MIYSRLAFLFLIGAALFAVLPASAQQTLLSDLVNGVLDVRGSLTLTASGWCDSLVLAAGGVLSIGSDVQASCGQASLSGGAVSLADSSSQLIIEGACAVSGSTNTVTGNGGSLTCDYDATGCSADVANGATLALNNVVLAPTYAQVENYGSLLLSSCTVKDASAIAGAASAVVSIANGATVCNAPLQLATPCSIPSGGELRCTDSGPVNVADLQELTLRGGQLSYAGSATSTASSAASVVVGTASGAGATLACRGNAVSNHAGGVVQLASANSQHYVEHGSSHTVVAPVVFVGQGKSHVYGQLAAHDKCTHAHSESHFHEGSSLEVHAAGAHIFVAGHKPTCHSCSHDHDQCTGETHIIGEDTGAFTSYEHVCDTVNSAPILINGGARARIAQQAQIHINQAAHTICQNGASEFHGAGQIVVEGAYECADVITHNHAATHIKNGGELIVSGAKGSYILGAGHQLIVHSGATCQHSNAGAAATHVVGSTQSSAMASIEHTADTAGAAPSVVNGGAKFLLNAYGQIHVQQGATALYKGTSSTTGSGKVLVEGTLQHEGAYTSNCAHVFSGSSGHVINQAYATSYGSLQYASNTATTLKAGATGFTAAKVAGQAQFAGSLALKTAANTATLPQQIPLYTCGSRVGSFSSAASDSSSLKGYIKYTSNGAVWYPYATGPAPAGCTPVN